VASLYSEDVITSVHSRPTVWELEAAPTEEKFQTTIGRLKSGKVARMRQGLPEMIVYGGQELWGRMVHLMQSAWNDGSVVD